MAKVDVHCHSIYSDQPIHWLFRKLGARESYTPVMELYHRLKSRGMDFVTITDHNRIDGALELAGTYPDCFVGCEFTVNFYREPAELHLCAYDLSEEQFRMGLKLREDIREFADYFREQEVLVTVPHPLHCNRGKLELRHLEQLLLLFDYFEEKNGLQMDTANRMQKELLDKLTPQMIGALQKKHGIESCSEAPWIKGRLGGSDDHSSFFLGRCWTEVDGAGDYREFLKGIREKRSSAHGQSMTALAFSHATQSNWINVILDQYCKPGSFDERLVTLVSRVQPQSRTRKWINRLASGCENGVMFGQRQGWVKRFFIKKFIRLRLFLFLYAQKKFLQQEAMGDCECPTMEAPLGSAVALDSFKSTVKELMTDWRNTDLLFNHTSDRDLQQETYDFVSNIFNNLYRYSFSQWLYHLQTGNIPEAFARLSLILPGILPAVPYVMGYKHFYYDNHYLKEVGKTYRLNNAMGSRPEKWGWFTDTLMDVNGVAGIIQKYTRMARGGPVAITAITSHPDPPPGDGDFISFQPLFHFPLPEYELMTLAIPPILDVIHHCEQQRYTRLIVSSPGPVGIMGLWVADLLNIPVSGIYHTDLPSYVARLTGDSGMEQMAWQLIRFFYGRMERVYVLSDSYRDKLVARGIPAEKIRRFAKGIDVDFFRPGRDALPFRAGWGVSGKVVLLYVGRVSREKDLDILHKSYRQIRSDQENVALVIVGDGPYLEELKAQMSDLPDVIFTGFVKGEALADIYGSCDIFAFPSTTDTYGTVLLEAQASGLPVVVSDEGGPKEVIIDEETGLVTRAKDPVSFEKALVRLISDENLRKTMGQNGRRHVTKKSWRNAFDDFIGDHLFCELAN